MDYYLFIWHDYYDIMSSFRVRRMCGAQNCYDKHGAKAVSRTPQDEEEGRLATKFMTSFSSLQSQPLCIVTPLCLFRFYCFFVSSVPWTNEATFTSHLQHRMFISTTIIYTHTWHKWQKSVIQIFHKLINYIHSSFMIMIMCVRVNTKKNGMNKLILL